jgi:hypothetical protein
MSNKVKSAFLGFVLVFVFMNIVTATMANRQPETDQRSVLEPLRTDEPTATDAPATETETPSGPTATETPVTPTATPSATNTDTPGNELVVNGGFENLASDGKPDLTPWVVKNSSGDKAKCNKDKDGDGVPDKVVAFAGNCAFQFKNVVADAGKLQQTLSVAGVTLNVGDAVNLLLAAQTKGDATAKVKVVVKYGDDTKSKISTDITNTDDVYQLFTGTTALTSTDVAKAKIGIKTDSTSGKVYVDDISVKVLAPVVATEVPTDAPTEEPTLEETATPEDTPTDVPTATETPV